MQAMNALQQFCKGGGCLDFPERRARAAGPQTVQSWETSQDDDILSLSFTFIYLFSEQKGTKIFGADNLC